MFISVFDKMVPVNSSESSAVGGQCALADMNVPVPVTVCVCMHA